MLFFTYECSLNDIRWVKIHFALKNMPLHSSISRVFLLVLLFYFTPWWTTTKYPPSYTIPNTACGLHLMLSPSFLWTSSTLWKKMLSSQTCLSATQILSLTTSLIMGQQLKTMEPNTTSTSLAMCPPDHLLHRPYFRSTMEDFLQQNPRLPISILVICSLCLWTFLTFQLSHEVHHC